MKNVTIYQNKKVLVLGLARSGMSAAKLLNDLGALVTVNDGKPFEENSEAQDLLALGIKVITGSHPIELLDEDFSLMVKNPGIPYQHPFVKAARKKGLPIITDVELAYQISEAPIIGITGTNGKTTTTTMIEQILNQGLPQGQAFLSGNIGYPASSVAKKVTKEDWLVMELSSFQLMGIDTFHPKIAVLTNLYDAHLDYHTDRSEYVNAKWHIQQKMTATDFLVLNWNQNEIQQLAKTTKAQVVPFSTKEAVLNGSYVLDDWLYYQTEKLMPVQALGVPGKHNVENALAAIAVAKTLGLANEEIIKTLEKFSGVPHRTQYVGQVAGVKYYNDSKATNILATKMALSGFEKEKVILLAGGLDRGNSFDELVPDLCQLKAVILFGETKEKLAEAAKAAKISCIVLTDDVSTAVKEAQKIAQPGESVLLSPANASWDQYPNFEVRGQAFIDAVQTLN